MKNQLAWICNLLVCAGALAGQPRSKVYDLASGTVSGDFARGPRRIVAKNLNVLRYDYRFNSAISYSQAVDLWAKLSSLATPAAVTSPAPAGGAGAMKVAAKKMQSCGEGVSDAAARSHICAASDVEDQIKLASASIGDASRKVNGAAGYYPAFRSLVEQANGAIRAATAGGNALKNFLLTTTGFPAQTVAGIAGQLTAGSTFITGTTAEWPSPSDVSSLAASTAAMKAVLDQQAAALPALLTKAASAQVDLQADSGRLSGADQTAASTAFQTLKTAAQELTDDSLTLTATASLNATILAGLPDLQQGSQKNNDFVAARELLGTWKTRMEALQTNWNNHNADPTNPDKPDPFTMYMDADCEFAFSRTKTTAITLSRVDQMPGTTATNPETVLSVSVECTSPFTVSAGVAFSTLAEREFGVQAVATPQGSTTTANQFVAVTQSSFHPLPIGMVHVRLWEPAEWFSFQVGFGVAGNIKSQAEGGSDADFLIGPSFAFFRTMFLTPGLHLGREVSLGGGYRLGDAVPTSVTTPPLQKSYKAAFGFAVTFTKP